MRRPHRQRMSSAANALLCNIAEGKQCNLLSYFSAHTRPPQRLNRAPKAGLAKSRGRHGSFPHYAHRRPNFTGDRSEARGHGAAHAALPPGWLGAGCACWCAPDGFAARKRRGGTQGAATPEGARHGGPPPLYLPPLLSLPSFSSLPFADELSAIFATLAAV